MKVLVGAGLVAYAGVQLAEVVASYAAPDVRITVKKVLPLPPLPLHAHACHATSRHPAP
jgi:hypothetical protein